MNHERYEVENRFKKYIREVENCINLNCFIFNINIYIMFAKKRIKGIKKLKQSLP